MAKSYYAEEISAVPFSTMGKALSQQIPAPLAYPIAACFRLRGLIGWPLRPTYGIGGLGSELVVPGDSLPPRARASMAGVFEQARDLGFQPLRFAIADVIGEKEHVASLLIDRDGGTLLTVEWMRLRGAEGVEETLPVEMNSYFGADPDVMTGWMPKEHIVMSEMMQIDFVDLHCIPNTLPLETAYEKHRQRTAVRSDAFSMTPEAAVREHEARTKRRFEWAVKRGLLREMRPKEVARVKQMRLPDASAPKQGMY